MPTTRIVPNDVPNFATGPLIGAGSYTQAISDGSDASYVELDAGGFLVVDYTSFALPAGAVVSTARNWVRAGSNSGSAVVQFQRDGSAVFDGGVGINLPAWVSNTNSASPAGAPMTSQTDVDSYRMRITSMAADPLYVSETVVDITYALVPTATVTGPTGTSTSTTPTVSWLHTAGADAQTGQTHYRVRVYDATTNVLVYDSGVVASAASTQAVGSLPINQTYRAVVNTAQVTNGVAQWSADATGTFAINVNAPSCAVTAPSGVVGTTSPTVTWTHTPGTGATTGQTYYRIRTLDVGSLTITSDTGPVASAATSATIGPLDPAKSWRVIVNTAQTTGGVVQWSPDATSNFTINVTPPTISSVVGTPSDATASISGVITLDPNSPLWETYDVQASYDGGATWTPVRGYTKKAAPFGTPVTVLTEPFNNLTAWTLGGSFIGGAITAGGKVGTMLRFTPSDTERGYPIPAASQSSDVDVSFWWRASTVAAPNGIVQLRAGAGAAGNSELTLLIRADGKLQLGAGAGGSPSLGVSTAALVANTWYRIRLVARLTDAGAAHVDVDGTTVINVSNVKTYVTSTKPTSLFAIGSTGGTYDYDELTLATTMPTPATFIDYEAPNDTPVVYRARATRTVSGALITGQWVLSSGGAATGQFRTIGARVVDPNGLAFRPKGLNVGTDFVDYWPPTNAYTQGGAAMVVQPGHIEDHSGAMSTYGLNMIRLNIQDGLTPSIAIPRIQQVIDAYTSKGVVVLLDPHDEYGESPTIATWLASWAPLVLGPLLDANKTNPYVWVAPGNEEYHNGIEESQWLAYHVGFYNWVRTTKTAPNTMIVADALNYAQDISHTSTYASLIAGRTNQIIGWHHYGGDYQSADGSFHDATEIEWAAWMQAAQNAGVPVQVHEFGQAWDPNDHDDHTYPGSDADERRGVSWVLDNWITYNVGGLAWHGTGAADTFNVRAVRAESFHGAWYDETYPLSDWGAIFFGKPTANVLQWTNKTNDTWIKDPAHPELALRMCVSSLPDTTYDRTVGVFRPVGARFPVVVSDVLQAPVAAASVMTRSVDEEAAFLALVSAPVLLVQAPALPWGWGSRYVAPGPVQEHRVNSTSRSANRLFDLTLVEVARPADESAT